MYRVFEKNILFVCVLKIVRINWSIENIHFFLAGKFHLHNNKDKRWTNVLQFY